MSGGIGGLLSGMFGQGDPAEGNGLLGNFHNIVQNNQSALMGFGSGMLAGDPAQAGQSYVQGQRQDLVKRQLAAKQNEELQKNTAAKALAQKYNIPNELATDADTVFGLVKSIEAHKQTPKEMPNSYREFQLAQQNPAYAEFRKKGEGGDGLSLNPVYGTDAQGNPIIMQLGKDGRARQTAMPEGARVSTGVEKVDLGTRWGLIDKRSGAIVGYEPKDLAGAEREKAVGDAEGKTLAAAPGQIDASNDALALIKQIKEHPNREAATGWESNFPTSKGGKTADFENLVEQAKSGAFLTAIGQMKGMGALSDAEGRAATAAVMRMNVATSDAGFMKAVDDYETYVKRGKEKAQKILGVRQNQPAAAAPRLRYNPQTGALE